MKRAIAGITVAYIIVMAAIMLSLSDTSTAVFAILVGEAVFASPIMIAYALSRWLVSFEARLILLIYQALYSLLTIFIFYSTFAGEPADAQYQLAILWIPIVGFPALVLTGLLASLTLLKRKHPQ